MARPSWKLMNEINYLNSSYVDSIENAKMTADTIVNIGSSVSMRKNNFNWWRRTLSFSNRCH